MQIASVARSIARHTQNGIISTKLALIIATLSYVLKLFCPLVAEGMELAVGTKGMAEARQAVALSSAAQAAGLDFVDQNDVEFTLRRISVGGTVEWGGLKGAQFRMQMDEQQIHAAKKFLKIEDGLLLMEDVEPKGWEKYVGSLQI